jgi:hypothetical protein
MLPLVRRLYSHTGLKSATWEGYSSRDIAFETAKREIDDLLK